MALAMEYSGLDRSLRDDCSQDKVVDDIFFLAILVKIVYFYVFYAHSSESVFLFDKLSAPIEGFPTEFDEFAVCSTWPDQEFHRYCMKHRFYLISP